MTFTPKQWVTETRPTGPPANPTTATPITGQALTDLETRLSNYTDRSAQPLAPTAVQTANYSANAREFVPVDITSASLTVILPAAPADGTRIGVKVVKVDGAHAHAATVTAAGTDVFNVAGGSTTLTLSALYQGVLLQYKANGGIWYVTTADTPLGQPLGAAKLGTDGTVGGPGGSGLTSSVATVSRAFLPSGGDDSAAIASFISSLGSAGGTILLGPGMFLWNAQVPALLRNTPVRIYGSGVGKTTIKLSSSARRAFDFGKVADYDVFNDIELADFTVDCNNVGGHHHVVLGTYVAGAQTTRISVNRLAMRRIRTINVPSDVAEVNHRLNVWIVPQVNTGDTACTLNDHVYEDLDFLQGGNMGLVVGASAASGGANLSYARISVRRVKHDTGLTNTTNFSSSNVQIGSVAYGGPVWIDEVYGARSGDVGLEVDGCTDLHVGSVNFFDTVSAPVLLSNLGYAYGSTQIPSQVARIESVKHMALNAQTATGSAVTLAIGNSTNGYGKVSVGSLTTEKQGTTGKPPLIFNDPVCTWLEFDTIHYQIDAANDTTTQTWAAMTLTPVGSQRVIIGSYTESLSGSLPNVTWQSHLIVNDSASAANLHLDIREMQINNNITFASVGQIIQLGNGAFLVNLKITGGIQRFRVTHSPSTYGINIAVTTAAANLPQWFPITDCDFTGMAGGTEINVNRSGTLDQSMLRLERNRWRSGSGFATVSAPAFPGSTTAVTNMTGVPVIAFVANSSGAITQVALGGVNTNMQIAASGWAAIPLPAGQTIAFTYASGTPAWTWQPAG